MAELQALIQQETCRVTSDLGGDSRSSLPNGLGMPGGETLALLGSQVVLPVLFTILANCAFARRSYFADFARRALEIVVPEDTKAITQQVGSEVLPDVRAVDYVDNEEISRVVVNALLRQGAQEEFIRPIVDQCVERMVATFMDRQRHGAQLSLFISYRRADTAFATSYVYKELTERFGEQSVFKDDYSIQPGRDFRVAIKDAIERCHVLIALIGKHWLSTADDTGAHRIVAPDDFVRWEIETALHEEISVIPLLIDDATMPTPDELPESLRDFAFKNALRIRSGRDIDQDLRMLVKAIERIAD